MRIDAAAIRRAVEQGYDDAQVIASLAALCGVPLDRDAAEQVRAWVKAAHSLTLRPLLVLTATDPATLRAVRADWRLRPLLENAISPHHLVVRTGRAMSCAGDWNGADMLLRGQQHLHINRRPR